MSNDEFYLGSSTKGAFNLDPIPFSGNSVTITVPDAIERVREGSLKASYHASGQFHVKFGNQYLGNPERWPEKGLLQKPFRIAALVTALPTTYEPYTRSLTRGGSSAVVVPADGDDAGLRHYFEFYLTPPGTFDAPLPMIKMDDVVADDPHCHSMNDDLILAIRHLRFAESTNFHTWQPDKSIWLFAREMETSDPPLEPNGAA